MDSNHLPPRYQHGALPDELAARSSTLAGAEGFEPSALGFGDRCSDQTELRPWTSRKVYPAALREGPCRGLGLAEGLFAEGQVV